MIISLSDDSRITWCNAQGLALLQLSDSLFMLPPISRTLINQFVQYIGVGGIAFLADFACLWVLTEHGGLHYLLAATAGFLLGLAVNYLLCLLWVFDFRKLEHRLTEFLLFTAIGIAGLLLNALLLWLLTELAGMHYLLSKIFAAGLILIFNFTLRRWMLFSPGTPKPPTAQAQETTV